MNHVEWSKLVVTGSLVDYSQRSANLQRNRSLVKEGNSKVQLLTEVL